jgi:hypothetical protein
MEAAAELAAIQPSLIPPTQALWRGLRVRAALIANPLSAARRVMTATTARYLGSSVQPDLHA